MCVPSGCVILEVLPVKEALWAAFLKDDMIFDTVLWECFSESEVVVMMGAAAAAGGGMS
jgi:hypothetical protein